jgi:chaperonin cofactor prefoldin
MDRNLVRKVDNVKANVEYLIDELVEEIETLEARIEELQAKNERLSEQLSDLQND